MKTVSASKVGYDEAKIFVLSVINDYGEIKRDMLEFLYKATMFNKTHFISMMRRYIKLGLVGVKNVKLISRKGKRGRKKIECVYYLTEKGKARLRYLLYKKERQAKLNKKT